MSNSKSRDLNSRDSDSRNQFYQSSKTSSTSLPDLHPDGMNSYGNGIDEIDLAVLANPTKLQPEIQKLSEHDVTQEVTEEEIMHIDEVSQTADEILMNKMETAGFRDQTTNQQQFVAEPTVGNATAAAPSIGFYNINQPPAQNYTEILQDNNVAPQDPFHDKFTAPQSELEASGMALNKVLARDTQSARTQPVRVNFADNNVVNTFDNSIMAATQQQVNNSVAPSSNNTAVAPVKEKSHSSSSSTTSTSNRKSGSERSSSDPPTESDASHHRRVLKERNRQYRKKERHRRERLPHERTYGELQEERYEDWEKKIQHDVEEAVNTEKRELLLLFAEKEAEGHKMLRKFTMASDINEMRFWFYKLLRDSRTDDEVAHLRSHLVEGTRLLLTLNDKVFDNALGLSDMAEFPDTLSSMLSGSWDRHIRDYVKSKHSLQGPPAQPLKNLGLNFLHLFISHHRKKAAEEQQAKAEREKQQREAVLAASKNGNPYDAIFGNYSTSLMRGREGVNPMQLPPYAATAAQNLQHSNDPEYQAFLQYKRAKEQAEFQAFQEAKNQMKQAPAKQNDLAEFQALVNARNQKNNVKPLAQQQQQQPQQRPTTESTNKNKNPPPSFLKDSLARMNVSASPLPMELGAPDVASIDDGSADFQAPASHKNSGSSAPSTRASNPGLAGQKKVSSDKNLLLSTSSKEESSVSSSSSSSFVPQPRPPVAKKVPVMSNQLPRAYQETSAGAKILQKIGTASGIVDERQVTLPPVPNITRESVSKLQQKLATLASERAREQEKAQAKAKPAAAATSASLTTKNTFKAVRPIDREKIAKLVQSTKPKTKFEAPESASSSESSQKSKSTIESDRDSGNNSNSSNNQEEESEPEMSSNHSNSQSERKEKTNDSNDSNSSSEKKTNVKEQSDKSVNEESEYDRILREMEEECEDLDSQESVQNLNDVKFVPIGAHAINENTENNRIIDLLRTFQAFMSEPPKGTRPTAQSSMFSDIDSLLSVDGAKVETKKKKKGRANKRMQISQSSDEEVQSDNRSSTASFRLDEANQELARQKIDSKGHFTF